MKEWWRLPVEVETSSYEKFLVVFDEFNCESTFDQMNLFVIISKFHWMIANKCIELDRVSWSAGQHNTMINTHNTFTQSLNTLLTAAQQYWSYHRHTGTTTDHKAQYSTLHDVQRSMRQKITFPTSRISTTRFNWLQMTTMPSTRHHSLPDYNVTASSYSDT